MRKIVLVAAMVLVSAGAQADESSENFENYWESDTI